MQNDKTIENLERDRRQNKEIDCRNAVDVVAQKRPPALVQWPRATAHVPSNRRLSDVEAKLEQFTMNLWRTPEWARTAQARDSTPWRHHITTHSRRPSSPVLQNPIFGTHKYYNEALTHLSLNNDAPIPRAVQTVGRILCLPILGGLHHQYVRI